MKLQLYEYHKVHDALIKAVKLFQDPLNPGTLIYQNNVRKTLPGLDKISLFGGVLGQVSIPEVPTIGENEIGEQVAKITGNLFTWIAGRDSKAVEKCQRYCDISRAYFMNHNLLTLPGIDLPGTYITVPDRYPNRFENFNLGDIGKKPVYYTVGATGFIIEKGLNQTVYTI